MQFDYHQSVVSFCSHITNRFELKTLSVGPCNGANNITDVAIISFANALKNNTSLTNFRVNGCDVNLMYRVWDSFAYALCDNSDCTYFSNHTLRTLEICFDMNCMAKQIPESIAHMLQMNANENKADVARQKIITSHFSSQVFSRMAVPVLPRVIGWIGRDLTGFNMMFHIAREILPTLLAETNAVQERENNRNRRRKGLED